MILSHRDALCPAGIPPDRAKCSSNTKRIQKTGLFRWNKPVFGAAGQIRTADLVITNDALYRLSYSSRLSFSRALRYYSIKSGFVKCCFQFFSPVWRLSLSAKELISSDALIFLRRNGGEAMKYECLKLEERRIIEEMYAKGAKPGEIAERVGKCQATIYRELERGKTGETDSRFRQGYSAAVAEARVNRSYRNRGRRKAAQ